jgi:hypothetical protein
MISHIEDRHNGSATERIALADLGDAVDASSPCPQLQDPAIARATTHVELDLSTHVTVCVLDDAQVIRRSRDEERGHARLQAALASVLAQGRAEDGRLDLSLEIGNPLGLPLRLTMHGVLKSLH